MTTAEQTDTQTYRWVARGFTEDITQCERCGKPELKGTVRMVSVDGDGDEGDTVFMGVTCAARMSGRKAEEIRNEARAADAARQAARTRWSEQRSDLTCTLRDQWLAERGHDIRRNRPGFAVISEALTAAAASPEMAAWLTANPEPVR